MSDTIEIQPISKPVVASIDIPGSKSYTNRALLIAALAEGQSELSGILFSDDTERMLDSLRKLGTYLEIDRLNHLVRVNGNSGRIPVSEANLDIGNSGTASRSLVCYTALGNGTYRFDGASPMRKSRPIADLLDALQQLGVLITSEQNNQRFPLVVSANGLDGGPVKLDASKSSQFLTALLMVAPVTKKGLQIELTDKLISQPYIDITLSIMHQFGVEVTNNDYCHFSVNGGQSYSSQSYEIEPDASSASYFFALAAITRGQVTVKHLDINSAQGDVQFVRVLEEMGCSVRCLSDGIQVTGGDSFKGINIDMNSISDTSLTLAAIAPFAKSQTTIRNIKHIRWQETDRLTAMVTELRKLGVTVVEFDDGLQIQPVDQIQPAEIETYNDHRVAMAFSLVGVRQAGVKIKDPRCVDKTFPTYFEILRQLGA